MNENLNESHRKLG